MLYIIVLFVYFYHVNSKIQAGVSPITQIVSDEFRVFVINMNDAKVRRTHMKKQFDAQKFNMYSFEDVKTPEIFPPPFVNIAKKKGMEKSGSGSWKAHLRLEYNAAERSLVSTIRSIAARNRGGNLMIMEDDVVLCDDFYESVKAVSKSAPEGWDILQFHINNDKVVKQLLKVQEPFVKWMPEYFSTAVMLLSPDGAKKLANKVIRYHGVADFWSYYNMDAYTHTGNWFGTKGFNDSMNKETSKTLANSGVKLKKEWPEFANNISVQALTTTFGDNQNSINMIKNLKRSTPFQVRYYKAPKGTRYSKYPSLHRMMVYRTKWTLMFDDDINFDAFPWHTFFQRVNENKDTFVFGLTRESIDQNTLTLRYSDKYKQLAPDYLRGQADYWKSTDAEFWREKVGDIQDIYFTKYVEQTVVLIRTDFLRWFFENTQDILEIMSHKATDWWYDAMWCGAAFEWNQKKSNKVCGIIPLPAWHEDHASLTKHYNAKMIEAMTSSGSGTNPNISGKGGKGGNSTNAHVPGFVKAGNYLGEYAKTISKYRRWLDYSWEDRKAYGKFEWANYERATRITDKKNLREFEGQFVSVKEDDE